MVPRDCAETQIKVGAVRPNVPAIEVIRLYLVKISFVPAIKSTVARNGEITRTTKRLLPKCEPTLPQWDSSISLGMARMML
jgi:hypothetical protein